MYYFSDFFQFIRYIQIRGDEKNVRRELSVFIRRLVKILKIPARLDARVGEGESKRTQRVREGFPFIFAADDLKLVRSRTVS